ncbi:hypothetical protein ACFPOE_04800 [Caenimonas terrae]|uniref:TonB-dependent receptor n=1 Tax=Caenimonas terrae TaxID=696074 RepID=A0ABW0N8M8_9BURK
MPRILSASLLLALAVPLAAQADTAADIAALRQEIDAIRSSYEQRLQALERKLQAAQAQQAAPAANVAAVAPPAAPAPGGGANAFNPALSLILSGTYGRTTRDPASYSVTGFPLPAGADIAPSRGFSLAESELGLSASIDPWLRGQASLSFHPDNTVSVEEAFVQTTSLGQGLSLKAGRFLSGIGYLNEQHSHTWDFADAPLAYQVFLGTQFADDGLQLRWLAPTDLFLEAGAEVGRGRGFPGSDSSRNGAGAGALFAHAGGDVGDSHSWRAGLSLLQARPANQTLLTTGAFGGTATGVYSGRARVLVADGVWKWAPNGNATRTNLKLQGEYLRSTRDDRAAQSGWYLQAAYQFMPRWRAGVRTERLDSASVPDPDLLAAAVYLPRKDSLMLEFNPSEFSRLRLQLARDRSRAGLPDNQLLLQYQMSLGAHGAHGF